MKSESRMFPSFVRQARIVAEAKRRLVSRDEKNTFFGTLTNPGRMKEGTSSNVAIFLKCAGRRSALLTIKQVRLRKSSGS
jgi:hypothetical protein